VTNASEGFTDKVVVITGGGQGIGQTYAEGLAARGAKVIVADLVEDRAEQVAAGIAAAGGSAVAVTVDVADPASVAQMAQKAVDAFGAINYLVNNAAVHEGLKIEPLISVDLEYYRRIIDVNLHGALLCARACYEPMLAAGGGAIVNQSSTASWTGGGYYSLSKAALNSLTVCLAAELGPQNIRVNAIAPGVTDTKATRSLVSEKGLEGLVRNLSIRRIGQSEDMLETVAFLLSDASSWLTGQIIAVDGGRSVRL
jgi:3-oxoacyl-[acyl-carrier protein] reductase